MSTIRLFKSTTSNPWELTPNKLFKIDELASYLANKTYEDISDFQYIKNGLEISIKIDVTQGLSQPITNLDSYKYVGVLNAKDNVSDPSVPWVYYFVKKAVWTSKNCVRFDLVMDVLNSLREGTDYKFKVNTTIKREHKSRFIIPNEVRIEFGLYINLQSGNLEQGDHVAIVNDHGDEVLRGYIYFISNQEASIEFDRSEYPFEDVIEAINDYISDDFEINNVDTADYWMISIDAPITSASFKYRVMRSIDYVQEGINPLLQCGSSDGVLIEHDNSLLRDDWYLLYRNQKNPEDSSVIINPVDCYLIPGSSKPVSTGVITSGQINANSLEFGKLYYIPLYVVGNYTPALDAEAYNQTITLSNGVTLGGSFTNGFSYVVVGKTSTGDLDVCFNKVSYNSADDYFEIEGQTIYGGIKYITINQSPTYYNLSATSGISLYDIFEDLLSSANRKQFTFNEAGKTLNPIDNLDRTDVKNIKLIKLPYCPYNFTITSNKIDVANSDWNFEELEQADNSILNCLKLTDLNTKLTADIMSSQNPLSVINMGMRGTINPQLTDLRRGANYESKLFASEFYSPKFVYDSFAFEIELDKYDPASYSYIYNFKIVFDMTKTINSKFMFTFDNMKYRNAVANYAKVMPIARNNEEVLYNVPYINYIRTGFNYDVKQKNINVASNWIGVGLSAISMGASLLAPSVPLKVAGVVGSLVSMAMSFKGAVVSQIQGEENLKQKILQAQNQTASVAGSDDVDLMSVYAKNRLKYLLYEPNAIMKELVYNLFYYAGYASNRMGIPSHNNRVNFDYLECEAVFDNEGINTPQELLDELKNCFKLGVTYIHKTNRVTDKWDIAQKYENWEKEILEV